MVAGVFLCTLLTGCSEQPSSTFVPLVSYQTAFVRAMPYPVLVVDIDYVEGYAPHPSALDLMMKALTELTAKRQVILMTPQQIQGLEGTPERIWTEEDFLAIAAKTSSMVLQPGYYGHGETAYLHILYLDGRASDSFGRFAGVHIAGLIGLWPDRYNALPRETGAPHSIVIEQHVLLHEVGHSFGLVNCGMAMTTPRESSRCHSANPDSVMSDMNGYFTIHPTRPWDTAPATWFDEDDVADIRAFRDAPES